MHLERGPVIPTCPTIQYNRLCLDHLGPSLGMCARGHLYSENDKNELFIFLLTFVWKNVCFENTRKRPPADRQEMVQEGLNVVPLLRFKNCQCFAIQKTQERDHVRTVLDHVPEGPNLVGFLVFFENVIFVTFVILFFEKSRFKNLE